jgi:hypothetical protein
MPALHFMQKKFKGLCLGLDEAIESHEVQLLFEDSWYWLHYRFFNCRDAICSETSSAVRTHLYNLAACLYRSFDLIPEKTGRTEADILAIISEVVEIAEYSRGFPISVWIHGDDTSKAFLDETLAGLPSTEQIERLTSLPHFRRQEMERLPYAHNADTVALKRYRNEEAAFNKRQKDERKNQQRKSNET